MSTDAERRSRLLSVKLRALVREHLGRDSDDDGEPVVFAPGAALVSAGAVWVLIDGDARRSLGATLAWVSGTAGAMSAVAAAPIHLLVESGSGALARRAALLDREVTVWHVDDRSLLPAVAEPHPAPMEAPERHARFAAVIEEAGAEPLVEHGIVTGEVRGLEICRVVDDTVTGLARLEVGMGAHDREAFAMVHGEVPTVDALRRVVESVLPHREEGADAHPFNMFAAERLTRWRALRDPASAGFDELRAVDPPVARDNVKDAVPCVAMGRPVDGEREVAAVFVHGVDLDVVPFALDAAAHHRASEAVIVARRRDIVAPIERVARLGRIPIRFGFIGE